MLSLSTRSCQFLPSSIVSDTAHIAQVIHVDDIADMDSLATFFMHSLAIDTTQPTPQTQHVKAISIERQWQCNAGTNAMEANIPLYMAESMEQNILFSLLYRSF